MRATAKIQRHDHRQTLELPDGFELLADEVWVRRDAQSGEIILTPKPPNTEPEQLARLFNLLDSAPLPATSFRNGGTQPRRSVIRLKTDLDRGAFPDRY
jgi:hypothetical protein